MQAALERWESLCSGSGALRFVDILLRGTGQVMFQNHPLTGLLFLVGIAWGSWAAGVPEVFFGGLLGLVVATLTAMWLRVDPAGLASGLFGYNGVLVGLALPTFMAPSPLLWAYVALGAAVSVVAMLGTANVVKTFQVSALTAPFVLVTWIMLLASHALTGLDGSGLAEGAKIVMLDPAEANPLDLGAFLAGVAKSISQVFLKGDMLAALLLLAGLAVSSLWAAAAALAGAVVAVTTAHLLGAESTLVSAGLLGFSPVLTAIALATVFYQPSARVVLYALLGTVFTVVVQVAMNVAFVPLGIPTLTAPFVLASWLFLLPRQHFTGEAEP
jgi:urea transporter